MMMETDGYVSAEDCADFLDVSISKLKSTIKDVNSLLKPYGAAIKGKTGRGNGYALMIDDRDKLDHFINIVMPEKIAEEEKYFADQNVRVDHIIKRLLESESYIRTVNLCNELSVSSSQLSTDLKIAKKILADYGIKVAVKPHYGIYIDSSEKAIRKFLVNLNNNIIFNLNVSNSDRKLEKQQLEELKKIILEECELYNYKLNGFTLQNLVIHLYIAIKRSVNRYSIRFKDEEKEKISRVKEFALSKKIVERINREFSIALNEDEVYYCTMHLESKKVIDDSAIDKQSISFISETLSEIDKTFGTDFEHDPELKYNLALHLIPLLSRIDYGMEMRNPLLSEIKRRYIYAFDVAMYFAETINREHHCTLSEDEISYLALHFQLSMDKKKENRKTKVLIVCATGAGTANLLKENFKRKYGNSFGEVDLMDVLTYEKSDVSEYSYVFSTVPISQKESKVYRISYFLDEDDDLEKIFAGNESVNRFLSYFDPELFLCNAEFETMESVLKAMTNRIVKIKGAPDDYYEAVLEREGKASTALAEDVAIPHPMVRKINETFVSACILSKKVKWNDGNNVRIVLLCNFEKGFNKKDPDFFKILNQIISSKKLIKELSAAKDYESFRNCLKEGVNV